MKTPTITHVEILCLAIRSIDADINDAKNLVSNVPADIKDAWLDTKVGELTKKRDALAAMYRMETGTDFD